jgi:hypothetical protein
VPPPGPTGDIPPVEHDGDPQPRLVRSHAQPNPRVAGPGGDRPVGAPKAAQVRAQLRTQAAEAEKLSTCTHKLEEQGKYKTYQKIFAAVAVVVAIAMLFSGVGTVPALLALAGAALTCADKFGVFERMTKDMTEQQRMAFHLTIGLVSLALSAFSFGIGAVGAAGNLGKLLEGGMKLASGIMSAGTLVQSVKLNTKDDSLSDLVKRRLDGEVAALGALERIRAAKVAVREARGAGPVAAARPELAEPVPDGVPARAAPDLTACARKLALKDKMKWVDKIFTVAAAALAWTAFGLVTGGVGPAIAAVALTLVVLDKWGVFAAMANKMPESWRPGFNYLLGFLLFCGGASTAAKWMQEGAVKADDIKKHGEHAQTFLYIENVGKAFSAMNAAGKGMAAVEAVDVRMDSITHLIKMAREADDDRAAAILARLEAAEARIMEAMQEAARAMARAIPASGPPLLA